MSKEGRDSNTRRPLDETCCYYVYGHYTADTDELFYIGKGKNHRHLRTKSRNIFWNRIVKKHGFVSKILISGLNEGDAFIQEILGIKELKPRANLTLGGEGASGAIPWCKGKSAFKGKDNPMFGKNIKDFMSPEKYAIWLEYHKKPKPYRIKSDRELKELSQRMSGENNPMFNKIPWNKGKHHSLETREKISKKAINRHSPRKLILWVEKGTVDTAVNIAKLLDSHPQSIRQAARIGIAHKTYRFEYYRSVTY